MANIVHLYTVESFRENLPLNVDVDSKILRNILHSVQETKLQQILGTELYNHILTLVVTGDISLVGNVAYKTLLDSYILKVLGYYGFADALVYISREVTDKGVRIKDGNQSASAEISEIRFMRKEWQDKAEFMAELLNKFLCKNSSDYPEYSVSTDGVSANREAYFSGIQFDDHDCSDSWDEDDCC